MLKLMLQHMACSDTSCSPQGLLGMSRHFPQVWAGMSGKFDEVWAAMGVMVMCMYQLGRDKNGFMT